MTGVPLQPNSQRAAKTAVSGVLIVCPLKFFIKLFHPLLSICIEIL